MGPVREALGLDETDNTVDAGQQTLTNLMGGKSSVKQAEHETPEKSDLAASRHALKKGAESPDVKPVRARASQSKAAGQDTKKPQVAASKSVSTAKSAATSRNSKKRQAAMNMEDGAVAKC